MKLDKQAQEPEDSAGTDEATVDQFLGGSLRADRLAELCEALRLRMRALRDEIGRAPVSEHKALEARLDEAGRQLAILRQEQAISQFVEDSVRVTLHQNSENVDSGLDGGPDLEGDDL